MPRRKPSGQVDSRRLQQDADCISIARTQGSHLRTGRELLRCNRPGPCLSPGLLTETAPAMRINREEVFGPAASVCRVRNYDEALAMAKDTGFDLTAGICPGV